MLHPYLDYVPAHLITVYPIQKLLSYTDCCIIIQNLIALGTKSLNNVNFWKPWTEKIPEINVQSSFCGTQCFEKSCVAHSHLKKKIWDTHSHLSLHDSSKRGHFWPDVLYKNSHKLCMLLMIEYCFTGKMLLVQGQPCYHSGLNWQQERYIPKCLIVSAIYFLFCSIGC